jgi:uncharacterized membrane protein
MIFTQWLMKAGPVVLIMFFVAIVYLIWFHRGRNSSRDDDNKKTSMNLDESIRQGSISKEDAQIIRDSLP